MPFLSHCPFLLSLFCVPASSCAHPSQPLFSSDHHVGKPRNTLPIFFPLRVPGSGSPPKPPELTDFEGSRLVSCSPLSLHFRLYLLVSASLSSIVKLCFPLHCDFPNTSPEDRNMERPSPSSPQALLLLGLADIPPAPSAQWLSLHPPLLLSWFSLFCQIPEKRK